MKLILATFSCAAALVLLATSRASAEPDELEALFANSVKVAEDVAGAEDADDASAATADASDSQQTVPNYGGPSPWKVPAELHSVDGTVNAESADHKQAPTSPINAVPEPSAIILALLALGYFLLFGRRRRIV